MKVTIAELNGIENAMGRLRGQMQQPPASCQLTAESVSFYDTAGKEIGYLDCKSGQGWIQQSGGGSEPIGGTP
jgi:hypothetical protein